MTGKTIEISYEDKSLRICNQRCREWAYPYAYKGDGEDLHAAGCGIFSLAHAVEWMTGARIDVEEAADFSVHFGGRGDDGTDRPALLAALKEQGRAAQLGFDYRMDGHLNDHEALWRHLSGGRGVALSNIRAGHIVLLCKGRVQGGERQALVVDSFCESADARVMDRVREVVPGSEIEFEVCNRVGLAVGAATGYAMYWVPVQMAADFNLLYHVGNGD